MVTGAGDGIRRGVARRFAAEGARVLAAELNPEAGARVAPDLDGEQ
ncbi:SDR family NAD(P)-dependent oxidoreductase [Actinomadura opuntiae]|nr:SDR family NAD(P)-dependent oxidoreductase [Actinomadura sp. OS1-43]MDL4819738.1 SDR family NAD(P)-dependent oxidoreductase [Actinomadura sp. OS1-43]